MENNNFALGTTLREKILVVFFRIFGCNHPDNMVVDLGDEDRGVYWYCFKCERKL